MRNINIIRVTEEQESYNIPATLEEVTNSQDRWWLIKKDRQYFLDAISERRLVAAQEITCDNLQKIVWASLIEILSPNWAELWTIYVNPEYRLNKIAWRMIHLLRQMWQDKNLNLLLTMKPNIIWSEWMIISATSNWFVPVSFNFLAYDEISYKNCCICDNNEGSKQCQYRDNYCILWIDSQIPGAIEASREYINSSEFHSAIRNEQVKNKVLHNVLNIINHN